eukprot:4358089-Amphidinium_carterae.1
MPSSGSPKIPTAKTPQMPQQPCTATASTTSSSFSLAMVIDHAWYTHPAMAPMIIASQPFTAAQPA